MNPRKISAVPDYHIHSFASHIHLCTGIDIEKMRYYYTEGCLNPCCNGRGSKTLSYVAITDRLIEVLILVVMEEGQRLLYAGIFVKEDKS